MTAPKSGSRKLGRNRLGSHDARRLHTLRRKVRRFARYANRAMILQWCIDRKHSAKTLLGYDL